MSPFGRILESRARVVIKLCGFALALAATAPLRAQTPVQFGDVITEPGVYFLEGNQSGSGTGIDIQSDDVTLLLLRFTLRGDGTQYGILDLGYDRVTIYGGRVTNFQTGIYLSGADGSTVRDVRVDHCDGSGMHVQTLEYGSFLRLSVDHNAGNGLEAYNCYDSRFVSLLAHDNDQDGILLRNLASGMAESTNKVRLCWCAYNGRNGIHVTDAHDNEISKNQCVNNDEAGIVLDSTGVVKESSSAQGDENRNNHVTSNWCVFNRVGIRVGEDATTNTLENNIALANSDRDLVDENDAPPCANQWFANSFFTRGGAGSACIF